MEHLLNTELEAIALFVLLPAMAVVVGGWVLDGLESWRTMRKGRKGGW
jgi:hypothetical protein